MVATQDPVVQAIQIADTLIAQYRDVMVRLDRPGAIKDDELYEIDVAEAERVFPAIWEHLDRARQGLGPVTAYDDLRGRVGDAARRGVLEYTEETRFDLAAKRGARAVRIARPNQPGLARAVEASAALKAARPDVDWAAAARAVADPAVNVMPGRRPLYQIGLAIAAIAAIVVLFVVLIGDDDEPAPAPDPDLANKEQKIALLRERLADKPCEAPTAETLANTLSVLERHDDVIAFAAEFTAACGENEVIALRVEEAHQALGR